MRIIKCILALIALSGGLCVAQGPVNDTSFNIGINMTFFDTSGVNRVLKPLFVDTLHCNTFHGFFNGSNDYANERAMCWLHAGGSHPSQIIASDHLGPINRYSGGNGNDGGGEFIKYLSLSRPSSNDTLSTLYFTGRHNGEEYPHGDSTVEKTHWLVPGGTDSSHQRVVVLDSNEITTGLGNYVRMWSGGTLVNYRLAIRISIDSLKGSHADDTILFVKVTQKMHRDTGSLPDGHPIDWGIKWGDVDTLGDVVIFSPQFHVTHDLRNYLRDDYTVSRIFLARIIHEC
jgi:hypothetical protein